MTTQVWFWIFYVLWILLTGFGVSRCPADSRWYGVPGGILLAVLLFLLGYKIFGSPIQ